MNEAARLATVAPDLVEALEGRSNAQLLAVSLAVVEWILSTTMLEDDRVAAAVASLRRGEVGDSESRLRVAEVVEECDERAWNVQESMAEARSDEQYSSAFAQARAANSVWSALDPDRVMGALDAAYEAQSAWGDVDGLRRVVGHALAQQ